MEYIKVFENKLGVDRDVQIEIFNEFNDIPERGLNLAGLKVSDGGLILNIHLDYKDVLELHNSLTEYIDKCKDER
ncbi:hypothetical protein UT300012_31280 [Paraclostridium bifermentans]